LELMRRKVKVWRDLWGLRRREPPGLTLDSKKCITITTALRPGIYSMSMYVCMYVYATVKIRSWRWRWEGHFPMWNSVFLVKKHLLYVYVCKYVHAHSSILSQICKSTCRWKSQSLVSAGVKSAPYSSCQPVTQAGHVNLITIYTTMLSMYIYIHICPVPAPGIRNTIVGGVCM
jgi:hypothetical protein